MSGVVPLRVNEALAHTLFPALSADAQGLALAGDLLATTRIIGMECPGLHSIYSEMKLRRRAASGPMDASLSEVPHDTMQFVVQQSDARFRSVRLGVTGSMLEGTLNAFFRAPPVDQARLDELAATVSSTRFAGQHALVVGGSRGLGELVAKLLLAGGAQVTLTYAKGQADAERIQLEALTSGRDVRILQVDAALPLSAALKADLHAAGITHLYHFATPQIAKSPTGTWNAALFDDFCKLYVHGFAELVLAAAPKDSRSSPLVVLYPSTVFLDTPAKGFAEYCAAKVAGEALCDHLGLDHHVKISKPRLPRLQTDQNSSFLGVEGEAPLAVMLAQLQALHPAESGLHGAAHAQG